MSVKSNQGADLRSQFIRLVNVPEAYFTIITSRNENTCLLRRPSKSIALFRMSK
jgi:hypothetical protein